MILIRPYPFDVEFYDTVFDICFILAAPVAFYMTQKWLEGFTYKVPTYWWLYVIAFLIVLLITLATVTFQSWRAATANPAESLKSE